MEKRAYKGSIPQTNPYSYMPFNRMPSPMNLKSFNCYSTI